MKAVKSTLNSWQEQACEPGPQCNLKWRRGVATSSFMSTFRNGAKLKVVMTDKKPDETVVDAGWWAAGWATPCPLCWKAGSNFWGY